jgi:hypothetical protein
LRPVLRKIVGVQIKPGVFPMHKEILWTMFFSVIILQRIILATDGYFFASFFMLLYLELQLLDRNVYKLLHPETDNLLQVLKESQKLRILLKEANFHSEAAVRTCNFYSVFTVLDMRVNTHVLVKNSHLSLVSHSHLWVIFLMVIMQNAGIVLLSCLIHVKQLEVNNSGFARECPDFFRPGFGGGYILRQLAGALASAAPILKGPMALQYLNI